MTSRGSGGKPRRALGRGLDALIVPADPAAVRDVPVQSIEPNPNQPRSHFERGALERLAASIKEHGILQPLVVSAMGDDRYRLIVGERRWRAAQAAGLERVPVIVREASDRQTLELALVENVQRHDLNPIEEAVAYSRLIQDFGLTQEQVAKHVGKSRVTIANTLRLLALPETLKSAVVAGRITEGHARAILALPDLQMQLGMLDRIEEQELSVRETEALVRRLLEGAPPRAPQRAKDPDIAVVEDDLRRALGTRVSLRRGKRGGRIVIEYYSDDEFQGLYNRLLGRE